MALLKDLQGGHLAVSATCNLVAAYARMWVGEALQVEVLKLLSTVE